MTTQFIFELTKDDIEFIMDGGELGVSYPNQKAFKFWVRLK